MATVPGQPPPLPADDATRADELDVFVSWTDHADKDPGQLRRMLRPLAAALHRRGVRPLAALLALDRRRVLWHLRAPDTETVEEALEQTAFAPPILWGSTSRELAHDILPNVAVESTARNSAQLVATLTDPARDLCLAHHLVIPVQIAISLDGRHMLTFYRAPDSESVRLAQRQSSVPPGRVWSFHLLRDGAD